MEDVKNGASTYCGLGVTVTMSEAGLLVTEVKRNSGASDAGIRTYDVISAAEGKQFKGLTFVESLALLEGDENSKKRSD